jgi:hypothetical protein
MRIIAQCMLVLVAACCIGCGGNNTSSSVQSPGDDASIKTRALEAGATLLQDNGPVSMLNTYVDGFHFYNGDMKKQMEAHHYCAILNEDFIQCIIYDGNVEKAKLMGIEYIISAKLFRTLPTEEKALWHSHVHEVKSGQLIAPGIPEVAEHELMEKLVGTYGKTLHTWHTDAQHEVPLGLPKIMMGFTADGQTDQQMVAERDSRMKVDSEYKRKLRADIPSPVIEPGADAWSTGKTVQIAES